MNNSSVNVDPILDEIMSLGKGLQLSLNKENIRQFLIKEINGDGLTDYLVISAFLSKDKEGLLVYVLTTAKIVKIQIDKNSNLESYGAYLKEVTGVNRKLVSSSVGNNAQVVVDFSHGSFGLQYPTNQSNIDTFFQKVDQAVGKIKAAS